MTIETRTTLELSDIQFIEFECSGCHARTAYPIETYTQPPIRCRACEHSPQWLIPGSEDFMDMDKLGRILQRFRQSKNGPFTMRLGIMPPAQKSESEKSERAR